MGGDKKPKVTVISHSVSKYDYTTQTHEWREVREKKTTRKKQSAAF